MVLTTNENEVLWTDSEISQYYSAIQILQNWLLDKQPTSQLVENAEKEVVEFLKAGTKGKRKKIFKDYFSQYDLEKLKQLISILTYTEDSAMQKKAKLIEMGMLIVTKDYLEKVVSPIKLESVYVNWLQGDIKSVLEKLKEEYENDKLSEELVKTFTKAFRKFNGKKLFLRITEVTNKFVGGIPVELTEDGYKDMQHPFLDIPWEVSAPAENASFEIGEIVEAYYNESRNEHYRHLLIYVEFRSATSIAQSLPDILEVILKPAKNENIREILEIPEEPTLLEDYIVKRLMERSEPLKNHVNQEFENLNNQLQEVERKQQQLQDEQTNLDEDSKRWLEIMKKIEKYKRVDQGEKNLTDEEYEIYNYERDSFIKTLQSLIYHNDEQQLIYQEDIIRSFMYSLQANVLTVLAGPSGTGKSSIVHAFARALENVEVRMVPVQSSWTDTQDLLGYFHPTDKAFVPTPFMEALAEANKEENAQKIFLICLDEMNLAHVEYYFSEILSAREGRTKEIHLYPKRHWETAKLILEEGKVDVERLQSARELVEDYPPVFEIPTNVRFIGTLNMDHTVKPLSPKVIDRSFIIEINHLNIQEKKEILASLQEIEGKIAMNYQTFTKTNFEENSVQQYIDKLQEISNLFESYPNAPLNSRGLKHLKTILTYCQQQIEMEGLIDRLIYGKILPRLEIKKSDFVQQESIVFNQMKHYPKSFEKLQKMNNSKHTITFW
ncbi:McrB family protein [Metalysinibacillus jejuensis]|uniref:McrB family protein n=1 Tax=Metalysinibacillus jejuensis TaxID=914327 RepID=UPI000D3C488D|nr:AAA family ATPase [Metalysinibacillus jejuensis]